ncbi:MAG: hypothetical protein QM703_11515 [Gemmatales bacterium]
MWKTILSSFGFLTLPVLVILLHLTSPPSTGGWYNIPIYALFFFPLFWVVCVVGGLIGLGIGALIDGTPAVPTKSEEQPETKSLT